MVLEFIIDDGVKSHIKTGRRFSTGNFQEKT